MRLALALFTAFAALAAAARAGWTTALDYWATSVAVAGRTPSLDALATTFTAIGSAPVILVALALAATYCVITRRPRALVAVLWTPLAFLLDTGVKALVRQPRPIQVAITPLPSDFGFPSGHTTVTSAFWLTVALLLAARDPRPAVRRFLVATAVGIALLVAWTRVYLGVHNLSDVCGGLLLGSAGAVAAGRLATGKENDGG